MTAKRVAGWTIAGILVVVVLYSALASYRWVKDERVAKAKATAQSYAQTTDWQIVRLSKPNREGIRAIKFRSPHGKRFRTRTFRWSNLELYERVDFVFSPDSGPEPPTTVAAHLDLIRHTTSSGS